MPNAHRIAALAAVSLALLVGPAGCVPKPKQNYTLGEIAHLESLEELMRVQAAAIDRQLSKRKLKAYSGVELVEIAEAARRLQATSATLREPRFSARRKRGFVELATQLNNQAQVLETAAKATDFPRISQTLTTIRQTCRACHAAHRD